MVRFKPVLNVTDLVRDAILLLLQQINRDRSCVVGLQKFHPLVIETVTFARESREFFRLVRHERVEVGVDLPGEILPEAGGHFDHFVVRAFALDLGHTVRWF
ncbi:hypothetical protein ACSHWG_01935 [Leucobacter sp. Z1108]|uniref:hypothetical protein n=1 Tax=Leucobacter sp. Z1108 TaxID=3439066 RepID=UPI003F396302